MARSEPIIHPSTLKDAERIARCLMALILMTAGTSKFFSGGGFYDYYSGLFQSDLRINIWPWLVNVYLSAIPFIEILLGAALLAPKLKPVTIYCWFAFMASLLVGHYVLQEWSAVNQMLDYFFLGLICFCLPTHKHYWKRDALSED